MKIEPERLRELIKLAGLGQREAAREIEISERVMRAYCAGAPVPRYVMLAMERLAEHPPIRVTFKKGGG